MMIEEKIKNIMQAIREIYEMIIEHLRIRLVYDSKKSAINVFCESANGKFSSQTRIKI